jgi:hypothetical protein
MTTSRLRFRLLLSLPILGSCAPPDATRGERMTTLAAIGASALEAKLVVGTLRGESTDEDPILLIRLGGRGFPAESPCAVLDLKGSFNGAPLEVFGGGLARPGSTNDPKPRTDACATPTLTLRVRDLVAGKLDRARDRIRISDATAEIDIEAPLDFAAPRLSTKLRAAKRGERVELALAPEPASRRYVSLRFEAVRDGVRLPASTLVLDEQIPGEPVAMVLQGASIVWAVPKDWPTAAGNLVLTIAGWRVDRVDTCIGAATCTIAGAPGALDLRDAVEVPFEVLP